MITIENIKWLIKKLCQTWEELYKGWGFLYILFGALNFEQDS